MNFIYLLLSNKILVTSASAWLIAQVIKTMIDFGMSGTFTPERLVGSGGMPSCHSATVTSLATITGLTYGITSFEFAVTTILAIIVMYDARGVRRETGTQAVVINQIMEYLSNPFDENAEPPEFTEQRMKELIGHTPLQVFFGALLGMIVAFLAYYKFYMV